MSKFIPWQYLETTEFGNKMEAEARNIIKENYNVEIIEITGAKDYKTKLYDFKTSDNIKYEVKGDRLSCKTNNFFIEYEGYGKPSGISISTADKWMLLYNNSFYIISQTDLLNLVQKETKISSNFKKDTWGKLIKVSDIEPYAEIVTFLIGHKD